tara:strand:+ start:550 stop:1263 length:714 start_codon:yes stop_codon:yes gene_type:complete
MTTNSIPSELLELVTEEEIMMFQKLQISIKELNNRTNLTRLVEGDDYWVSQVYDSIWTFKVNSNNNLNNKKYIDIGSGCGFPGFAYAITHPNSEIFLVDSSKKKTDALKEIIKSINFKNNIYVINDRIENLARQSSFRNSFNIATARAVSNPSTVSEYVLPMLKANGLGILYCGKWSKEDNKNLEKTLKILEGKIVEIKNNLLPRKKGPRNTIYIEPKVPCPENYPRSIGKAEKYPL